MKFRFKLQSFLKLVQMREDRKKMELGRSLSRVQELENSLIQDQQQLRSSLPGSNLKKDLALWMAFGAQAVMGQLQQMNEYEAQLKDEEERRDLVRGELAEVSSKRQGLENLRDNLAKQFRLERDKKEQKEMEDVSRLLKRFVR